MKIISTFIVILLITGCTTLKPVELSPDQLHDRIATGDVINEGDKVKIVTADGERYQFKVVAITDASIVGNDVEVPIVDTVALETTEFSGGKTAALVGGSYVALGMLIVLALGGTAVGL